MEKYICLASRYGIVFLCVNNLRFSVQFSALEKQLQEVADMLYEKMDDLLPVPEGTKEQVVMEAMRYSSLSHGKRLRPFLTVMTSQLFGVSLQSSLQAAAAIEFIHVYSLIHDDLPAMDNDDFRRGQPSCHKKFDEATAILAGDALLTHAFHTLADDETHRDCSVRIELIAAVAKAVGYSGMVGGQMLDMISEKEEFEFSEIVRLQRMKTGALFALSCETGAILGKASRNLRNALRAYANNLGLAFQITDDLLDAEGTRESTGKTVNKDKKAGKKTFVSVMGIQQAREHAAMLAEQAVEHLAVFRSQADILRDLAKFVIHRQK
jgi:farnesyl diphosphate synthase